MTTIVDMKGVLRTLRGARSLAIEALKRDFPDLYDLSADAFDTALGSIDHHIRLGEFLTEWDNSLGRSPVEALASGQRGKVLRIFADRSGSVLEFDEVAEAESPPQLEPSAELGASCIAYCNYYATGEGVTHFIAAGSSAACAEHAFRQHVPDYFQRGMETAPVAGEWSSDATNMWQLIPQFAADIIAANPPGTTFYYATLHFNLA